MAPALLPSAQWPTFAVAANPHRLICPFRTFGIPYAKPISAWIATASAVTTAANRNAIRGRVGHGELGRRAKKRAVQVMEVFDSESLASIASSTPQQLRCCRIRSRQYNY